VSLLFAVTSANALAGGQPTGLWLEEYAVPYCALAQVGVAITVASPKGGAAPLDPKSAPPGRADPAWAPALAALNATVRLAEVSPDAFDGVFIAGGHGAMVDLAGDGDLRALIEAFARDGKVVAAICHGPAALTGAKAADGTPLLKGRRATAFTNAEETNAGLDKAVPFLLESEMRAAGALFEHAILPGGGHVVCDGALITGQNPASSLAMAKALAEAIAARQRAAIEAAATAT